MTTARGGSSARPVHPDNEKTRAEALRRAILEGYEDVRCGRMHAFTGNLESMLEEHRSRQEPPRRPRP